MGVVQTSYRLIIQNLDRISASVFITPFWRTRSCACLAMRLVIGWLLGIRIGYLVAYGISELVSRPPQRRTPCSSSKRLNCLVRVFMSDKVFCALFTQRSSVHGNLPPSLLEGFPFVHS